jgi:hypothetical protein
MLIATMMPLALSEEDANKSNTNMTNMTTNQGYPIADDENSQTVGEHGPTLLQDFQFIEKIAHFDRERIPENGFLFSILAVEGSPFCTPFDGRQADCKL